jgi:chemotaxis protein CheZ
MTDTTATAATEAEPSDDELQALFDEVSANAMTNMAEETTAASAETVATAVADPAEPEPTDQELQALFDEVSADVTTQQAEETATDAITQQAEEAATDAGKPIYDRIGAILRQLHNSMRELGYDRALKDVATEVTDAKGRLEYVASLTEQAATKVLNSIDIAMPQQEEMAKTARDLEERWAALFDGKLDIGAFKQLAQDSRDFATNSASRADEEKARLMDIMMAQDFQDITGQVIKKVVVITNKLERELAQLLRDNAPPETREKVVELMSGPDVPEKALAQDDVDSLLANLGF